MLNAPRLAPWLARNLLACSSVYNHMCRIVWVEMPAKRGEMEKWWEKISVIIGSWAVQK